LKDGSLAPLALIEKNLQVISKNSLNSLRFDLGGVISVNPDGNGSTKHLKATLQTFSRYTKEFFSRHPLEEQTAKDAQRLLGQILESLRHQEKLNKMKLGCTVHDGFRLH